MHLKRSLLFSLLVLSLSVPIFADDAPPARTVPQPVFLLSGQPVRGICVTKLPDSGFLLLGSRQIRTGDVLTAAQLEQLSFVSAAATPASAAEIRYLPVLPSGTGKEVTAALSLSGRRDQAPVAEDFTVETYRELPREDLLPVHDPENQPMTYRLTRPPRRGNVILRRDGSFLYSPAKNKVGTDSFSFTAADPGGNVSREATVTVKILKPTCDVPYADTAAEWGFFAEWLRCCGIFSGETVGGTACFSPEKPVSGGQFLAMLMETLKLPAERTDDPGACDAPLWLQPYLLAARRCGIIRPRRFSPEAPVETAEAARMARQAVCVAVPASVRKQSSRWNPEDLSVSGKAVADLAGSRILTRAEAARMLYEIREFHDKKALISSVFQ